MISWLKGQIIQKWQLSSKRGIVLDVGGIGYEVQLLSKQIDIIENSKMTDFWIHQIIRDDSINLYGFKELDQRDLFRIIIGVTGVGPQIGLSLLEEFEVNQLANAIKNNNLTLLTRSHGIGKRIAERLVIELKNKLQQFNVNLDTSIDTKHKKESDHFSKYIEEISSILTSLGYINSEIEYSIELIKTQEKKDFLLIDSLSAEAKTELMDKHLKKILIILSQRST